MTAAADLVAQLAEAGTPPQLLAAVARELFTAEAERAALTNRREKDAARQQSQRAKKVNGHAMSRDVTHCHNGASDATIQKEKSPDPLKKNIPSVVSNETTSPVIELKPEHVVEAWNARAPRLGLKEVRKFTSQRQRKLATRIRQNTIDEFTEAIAAIERSPFLRGENDRGWRADFDWMLEPKNFTKLIEGTYDR